MLQTWAYLRGVMGLNQSPNEFLYCSSLLLVLCLLGRFHCWMLPLLSSLGCFFQLLVFFLQHCLGLSLDLFPNIFPLITFFNSDSPLKGESLLKKLKRCHFLLLRNLNYIGKLYQIQCNPRNLKPPNLLWLCPWLQTLNVCVSWFFMHIRCHSVYVAFVSFP